MIDKNEKKKILLEAEKAYENNDMDTSISLFKTLAENDVPEACQYLGLIYKSGDGVVKDNKAASLWYSKYLVLLTKQANSGDTDALLKLGKAYQYGENVEVNERKALELIKESAKKGNAEAKFHLACIFLNGWCGVRRDRNQYEKWLSRALEDKYPEAQYMKGLLLIESQETHYDGVTLLEQAAKNGFWPAKEYLEKSSRNH